jgi:hypothetical protein
LAGTINPKFKPNDKEASGRAGKEDQIPNTSSRK